MSKLLSKLKSNLEKANEVLEENSKIVSNSGVSKTKVARGNMVNEKTKEKVEGQEKMTDM